MDGLACIPLSHFFVIDEEGVIIMNLVSHSLGMTHMPGLHLGSSQAPLTHRSDPFWLITGCAVDLSLITPSAAYASSLRSWVSEEMVVPARKQVNQGEDWSGG